MYFMYVTRVVDKGEQPLPHSLHIFFYGPFVDVTH